MRFRDLNSPPDRTMKQLVQALENSSNGLKTGAHGTKHMGRTGDSVWYRPDGTEHSVRDIDDELQGAQGRIEDAEQSLADTQVRLEDAEQTVAVVQGDLDTLETVTLPNAVETLEQADQAAQTQFTELDTRLDTFGDDPALESMRQALSDAQATATSASEAAAAADQAASAASQAALEAAGIAESKGRVIIQATEPTGEDRDAANIWIKPAVDDPNTDITETATTYVYIADTDTWMPTTSDELAQAAQNALDAREAAQQAQQRADTAISNAATAQAAAEAAQRTADEATLDARTAHNEAVAAQADVAAKIESGTSMIVNGSFESGWGVGWIRDTGGGLTRADILDMPGTAHSGTKVLDLFPVDGIVHPSSNQFAVHAGQVLHVRAYFRRYGGAGTSDVRLLVQTVSVNGGSSNLWVTPSKPGSEFPFHEWVLVEGDVVMQDTDVTAWAMPYVSGPSLDKFYVDDFQVVDVTAARAAQARADEAYAEAALKLDESQVDAKITASANGKNSITRSTSAPSGGGVVEGDAWYQVDANGDAFAQWYWDGTDWVPSLIKNEMMESLDVHKLQVTGEAEMDSAVIDKLWVDGLVGKTATFNRLTVASGDLVVDGGFEQTTEHIGPNPAWSLDGGVFGEFTSNLRNGRYTARIHGTGRLTQSTAPVEVTAGDRIRFAGWFQTPVTATSGIGGLRINDATPGHTGELRGPGVTEGTVDFLKGTSPYPEGGVWHEVATILTVPEGVTHIGWSVAFANVDRNVYMDDLSARPMTGAVLIEDGAVTTPKLTVTEDMSAAIVNAMSVNAKKLVVTEEAILNHATLIGQTVVDDINVQGKLIGTDGVFTGTVDFANINVTGEILGDMISGEHIYGTIVEGGEFRTTEGLSGGQFVIADDGFVFPDGLDTTPGLRFEYPSGGFIQPAGIGTWQGDLRLSGGRSSDGTDTTLTVEPTGLHAATRSGGVVDGQYDSTLSSGADGLRLTLSDPGPAVGETYQVHVNPPLVVNGVEEFGGGVDLRARRDSLSGRVMVYEDYVSMRTSRSGSTVAEVRADDREAYLWSSGSDGSTRILSVDSDGVWVKTNESGAWKHYNLNPQQTHNPFTMPSGWVVDGGNDARYTITLGMCYWSGVIAYTGTLSSGWNLIGYAPQEAWPREGDQLRALPTSSGRTVLGNIDSDDGRIEIWLDQSSTGIFMHFSPFSYLVG